MRKSVGTVQCTSPRGERILVIVFEPSESNGEDGRFTALLVESFACSKRREVNDLVSGNCRRRLWVPRGGYLGHCSFRHRLFVFFVFESVKAGKQPKMRCVSNQAMWEGTQSDTPGLGRGGSGNHVKAILLFWRPGNNEMQDGRSLFAYSAQTQWPFVSQKNSPCLISSCSLLGLFSLLTSIPQRPFRRPLPLPIPRRGSTSLSGI